MKRPLSSRPRRQGFALLITVTLLAFLVLLLVALSTLTRVETQVAANNRQVGQARQNALLALNMALGELQRHAGPDQRVTATATLGEGALANERNVAPRTGSRHWTSVWRNLNGWEDEQIEPRLLTWLVSGNETAPVTQPAFAPDGTLPTLDADTTALTSLGSDAQPWQLLVGRNTVGETPENFVAVPMRKLEVSAGLLPGFSSSGNLTVGRYAWWVGDEGVKAKVSLIDPIGTRSTPRERSYSFITAQRYGIEQVRYTDTARLGASYPINDAKLADVLALRQLPLTADGGAQTNLRLATRERFHDLTAHAVSVLADVSRGGLKKDLTAWTEIAGSDGPADTDPIVPGTGGDFLMPQWGILRSYAQTEDDGQPKAPVLPTQTQNGLHPVITHARLAFGTSGGNAADNRFRILIFPTVVLWNPTSVPIRGEYEFLFGYRNNTPRLPFYVVRNTGTEAAPVWTAVPGAQASYRIPGGGEVNTASGAAFQRFYRFKVEEVTIPPGQSLVFALKKDGEPYAAGANLLSPLAHPVPAERGDFANAAHVAMDALPVGPGQRIRWGGAAGGTLQWRDTLTDPGIANLVEAALRVPVAGTSGNLDASIKEPQAGMYQYLQSFRFANYDPAAAPLANGDVREADDFSFFTNTFYQPALGMQMTDPDSADAVRWLSQSNPRGHYAFDGSWPTRVSHMYRAISTTDLPVEDDGRASAGLKVNVEGGKATDLVLSEFRPAGVPLFSLAQLQHAHVSLLPMYPAHAIGNSIVNPFMPRLANRRTDAVTIAADTTKKLPVLDLSWHLNRALWDRYYFSTVPTGGSDAITQADIDSATYRLPNGRMRFYRRGGVAPSHTGFKTASAFSTNAANLLVEGGFNVNSASVDAWRALLAGLNGVAYDPLNPADTGASLAYPFSRYAAPRADLGTWRDGPATPGPNGPWGGYRTLTAAAIDGLAERIVDEVKKRGPFLSLADFVNRRLAEDDTADDDGTGFAGAIQAALHAHDTAAGVAAADRINLHDDVFTDASRLGPASGYPYSAYPKETRGGRQQAAPYSSRAASAPGYLTQADILTAVGPALSARSDTFMIRTYGDAQNPATGEVTGRAWCEAVVQRLPDYADPSDPALASLGAATDPGAVGTVNQTFGRQFRMVSFRWLAPDEI